MRYFLLGAYGIELFKQNNYKTLFENKNKWELVGHDSNLNDITELAEHLIGWDSYLEISEEEVKYFKKEQNVADWNYLFMSLEESAGEVLSDGEMLDYLMENFKVPELL